MKTSMRRPISSLLAAVLLGTGLVSLAAAPAQAACTGVGCDNEGPKTNGCFADKENVASGGENATRLYYSETCHAFWAWSRNGAAYNSTEVHLEMEELVRVDSVTQEWQFRRRLIIRKPSMQSNPDPEWTNALGARTDRFRFRALWVDNFGGLGPVVTPWARGGR